MKKFAPIALALLLINPGLIPADAQGKEAPGWKLNDLEGAAHELQDWRGKWVLMKLGTVHCPNCKVQLREMAEVQDRIASYGVEVLDIYLRNDRYSVKKHLEKHPSSLERTVLYDWKGGLVRDYRVSVIPHLVLVDPQGEIRWEGRLTPAEDLLQILEGTIPELQETAAGGG